MALTKDQRKSILAKVRKHILKSHFNVAGIDYNTWVKSFDERSPELLTGEIEAFEAGVQDLLKELGSSHTDFYHDRPSRLMPQHTINATLGEFTQGSDQLRWFFLDVFEEGPADRAGIKRGAVLHQVDGVAYAPPNMPLLRPGARHSFSIAAPDGTAARQISIEVPTRKGNKDLPPILPPKSIISSMIGTGIGLLRITWFPGAMGLGFAKGT